MIKIFLILSLLILNISCWNVKKSVHGNFQDYDFNSKGKESIDHFKADFSCQAIRDPTNGNCDYIKGCQEFNNLVGLKNNRQLQLKLGDQLENSCMTGSGSTSPCYPAIRVQSENTYNADTLIVVKAQQIPHLCSLWPAFWMTAANNWPNEGELDIIEFVNGKTQNSCTMHTNNGCSMEQYKDSVVFNGRSYWSGGSHGQPSTDCFVNSPNQYSNQGCSTIFNNIDYQGTYATEWIKINQKQTQVNVYYWHYNENVGGNGGPLSNNPNPRSWNNQHYARFVLDSSNCPSEHFQNARLIINTAICGDWAGSVFGADCPNKGSCQDYLRSAEFQHLVKTDQASWIIDQIKIFE